MSHRAEVETGDPAVRPVEGVPGHTGGVGPFGGGENLLELLGVPDRGHPGPARRGLRIQVTLHHVDLAVVSTESDDRDRMVLSELPDVLPEPGADLQQNRR